MQRRTFLSLKQNGRLANLDNYNINKDSSFFTLNFDLPILGGSLQEVKFLFCIEITPNFDQNINKDFGKM
jgi:hypothetical protein